MASKSGQPEVEKVDVEEALDFLDKTMERLKTLYEQYFLGMQKQPPSHMHSDVERRIRDLLQIQIRNTGLRYRFATIQQKFGSYNSYWRRTLRQIEQGTYHRQLAKLGRKAAETGQEIPEEILAAMPKRMREQVKRDRDVALAIAARRRGEGEGEVEQTEGDDALAHISEPAQIRNAVRKNQHVVSEDDGDMDFEKFFASMSSSEDTNPDAKPFPAAGAGDDEDEATTFSAGPPSMMPPPRAVAPRAPQPPQPQRATGPVPAVPAQPPQRATGPVPTVQQPGQPPQRASQPVMPQPPQRASQPVIPPQPPQRASQPVIPPQPPQRASQPVIPPQPGQQRATGPVPQVRAATGPVPAIPQPRAPSVPPPAPSGTGQYPRAPSVPPAPPQRPSAPPQQQPSGARFVEPTRAGTVPGVAPAGPAQRNTGPIPVAGQPGSAPIARPVPTAPSQAVRPNPIRPGASQQRPDVPVQSMQGPFPRAPAPTPRPEPQAPMRPPPGMNDADVNALYAKYVQAKQAVGADPGPGAYGKLLKTINAQAPKIMEQYKAKGVEFSVVVKDNQVIIKAKPKP